MRKTLIIKAVGMLLFGWRGWEIQHDLLYDDSTQIIGALFQTMI